MNTRSPDVVLVTLACLLVALPGTGCESASDQVVIFHAASLSGVLSQLEEEMERHRPGLDIRLEPSGSQVAARKVSELNRRADLILVADFRVIDRILVPAHADANVLFASNEIVLAHAEHSRHTGDITSGNWSEILLRPDVRLGRADENLAPIGFHTLLAWKLAGPDLASRLKAKCRPEHVTPDVAELVSLLESRTIDYAFLFRSLAEEHNLKVTALPPEVNLSRPDLAGLYARASVEVKMRSSQKAAALGGVPILYSLALPRNAPNPVGGEQVAERLLGSRGRSILQRYGFSPLDPAVSRHRDKLPPGLRSLVKQGTFQ